MAIEVTMEAIVVVRGAPVAAGYTPPTLVPPDEVTGGAADVPFNAPRASGGGAATPDSAYLLTFNGGGADA